MIPTAPSTQNYTVLRGIAYIGEWSGASAPASYVDLGNCPKMEAEVTETTLDHFSYRVRGRKTKDKSITLESGYNINFDLDEMAVYNLKVYLRGTLRARNVISAGTALLKEYALKFFGYNSEGEREKWEFWKCKLTPNGALGLLTDDWIKMSFKGEGLADDALHAEDPFFIVTLGTTTTVEEATTTT